MPKRSSDINDRQGAAVRVRLAAETRNPIYSPQAFPSLRNDGALISFNRQLKRCNYDLQAWRELIEKRGNPDMLRGFQVLEEGDGQGWALLQTMVRFKARERISAGGALAHPFFHPGGEPLYKRLTLALLRVAYRDNSKLQSALMLYLARSGTKSGGGSRRHSCKTSG